MLAIIDWGMLVQEYGKYIILAIAALIVAFTNVSIKEKVSGLWSSFKARSEKKKAEKAEKGKVAVEKVVTVVSDELTEESEKYLKAVDLWYQLREQLTDCNLVDAQEKLEEVFPLLCQSMSESKPATKTRARTTNKKK